MRRIITTALLSVGLAALALSVPAPTSSASAAPQRAGKQIGKANGNVHKPKASASRAKPRATPNRNNNNRNNNNKRNNKRGDRNVVAGNTVVVSGRPSNGYYDNGRYNNGRDWDDDDDSFLEFVGKTAAITAGVSIVGAVIGDVVKDKPDDCQPVNAGGQQMLSCNGVLYQSVSGGYQVMPPPR